MNDIINVPSSVRQHMQNAMSLVQQHKPMEASILVGTALTELARSEPDLFGALVAAKLGVDQITIETRERIPVERKPISSGMDFFVAMERAKHGHSADYTERVTTKTIRIW